MLQEHLQQKNIFLRRAYEEIAKHAPGAIYSTSLNPVELGKELGYDYNVVRRIMHELVADGYATSSLGMHTLYLTNRGVNYLHKLDAEPTVPVQITTTGDNQTVQFQLNSPGANQSIHLDYSDIELERVVSEIQAAFNELCDELDERQANKLKLQVEYLEDLIREKDADKNVVRHIIKAMKSILSSVPGSIIANLITSPLLK